MGRTKPGSGGKPALLVYRTFSVTPVLDAPAYDVYIPHRVLRMSLRFVWVHTEPYPDAWSVAHPEDLRTWRLDRQALEAGETVDGGGQGRGRKHWVLHIPLDAVEQYGRYVRFVQGSRLPTLGR
jgi:hypothetical protein